MECIGKPVDLLCSHKGVWHVVEVKNEAGKNRLTADQVRFIERSQAEIHIVRTPDDALRAILGPEHVDKVQVEIKQSYADVRLPEASF